LAGLLSCVWIPAVTSGRILDWDPGSDDEIDDDDDDNDDEVCSNMNNGRYASHFAPLPHGA
jgi:hypothetical protein